MATNTSGGMDLHLTGEQVEILIDALFEYKCAIKSRAEQNIMSPSEVAEHAQEVHEIDDVLLPKLEAWIESN